MRASKGEKDGWQKVGEKETISKHMNNPVSYHIPAHGLYMCSFVYLCRNVGKGSFLP